MADLSEIQSSGSTKIAGADPATGVESNFLQVGATGAALVDVSGGKNYSATGNSDSIVGPFDVSGQGTAVIQVTGTYSATLAVYGYNNSAAATQLPMYQFTGGSGYSINSPLTNIIGVTGMFLVNVSGFSQIEIIMSPYTSGTATFKIFTSPTAQFVYAFNDIALGQSSTTATQIGVLAQGAVTTNAPTYVTGKTNPLSLTTSGALRTQDLQDAGRNQTNFFMAIQIVSTGTDALMSLTGYKSNAAVGATTTPAVVTTAKTYRIQSITMDYTTIVTTPGSVRFTLRANTGGVVAITSPAVAIWEIGEPTGIAPVAGKKNTITLPIPDGLEFAAGTGIGISMVGLNTVGAAAAVGYGRITISGYEY